jgi:hypothetical protein
MNPGTEYFSRSPSRGNPEKDLAECLFRVASQVSLRQRVQITTVVTGNRMSVSLDYQKNNYAFLEKMSVQKYYRDDSFTEAIIRVSGTSFKVPRFSVSDSIGKTGKPGWVTNPPSGSGYYSGLGTMASSVVAGLGDGFEYSDMNAIGALALVAVKPQQNGDVKTYSATLSGAFIARRWYDEATGVFYSLAISPR